MSQETYPVVDLFAGPGGLGEGFSAYRTEEGTHPFQIELSVEKEESAHRTLRFRAFWRMARRAHLPVRLETLNPKARDAEARLVETFGDELLALWERAGQEALRIELDPNGGGAEQVEKVVDELHEARANSILIGGPPCQAYSLVGRARNQAVAGYRPEDDGRHFLYKEYVRILSRLKPAAFVMENVKGILSARVSEQDIFSRIRSDLEGAGYILLPLCPPDRSKGGRAERDEPSPQDFVIRAEEVGIPQARHRVIVVGIKRELAAKAAGRLEGGSLPEFVLQRFAYAGAPVVVDDALSGLPHIRSQLSRRKEGFESWDEAVTTHIGTLRKVPRVEELRDSHSYKRFIKALDAAELQLSELTATTGTVRGALSTKLPEDLREWLAADAGRRLFNHEARGHMASDLARYLYAACFGVAVGESPKCDQFPDSLAPDHRNWRSGKFADRFRVQLADRPSTTVTSHISKDGHYFIHPKPWQCRSLTVREAARLQTFADDYFFEGPRTSQFVQVGNAVPPRLAQLIAASVREIFL